MRSEGRDRTITRAANWAFRATLIAVVVTELGCGASGAGRGTGGAAGSGSAGAPAGAGGAAMGAAGGGGVAGRSGAAGASGVAGASGDAGAAGAAGQSSAGRDGGAAGAPNDDGGAAGAIEGGTVSSQPEPGVGAVVPFTSYEAESGTLGGGATVVALTSPPTTRFSSPEVEASGHAFVKLGGTGQYVEWTNNTGVPVTFINVRESIPDAPTGYGIDSTLDVYVNGTFRQSLAVNSHQTWGYEGNNNYNNDSQDPSNGDPRTFWDETHAFVVGAPLAPGDKIRVEKSAGNSAAFYDVDVIDLEAPPPPIAKPDGALSIADFGVVANDPNADNSTTLQNAINAAQTQGKTLYLPKGTYYFKSTGGLVAKGITIQGAGMWYSVVSRNVPLPNNTPLGAVFDVTSCQVRDFGVDSNARSRQSIDGAGGAMDTSGTNWLADHIWTQHTLSGFWASGSGGTVQNCRLTAIWADGCNVNNVSLGNTIGQNLTVQNNFVRGTGDDAIAINSVDYNGDPPNRTTYTPMSNVKVAHNTSIAPWGGKGVAIYGGSGHVVENNYMSDTARYIGLGVGKFGVNGSDLRSATVTGNVVVRCGGNAYEQQQPALHIGNGGDGQGVGVVENAMVTKNVVRDALYNGVAFSTSSGIVLDGNTIDAPGLAGIVISPPFYPAPTGSATITNNTVTGLIGGAKAFVDDSTGFQVTQSGNSW